MSTPTVTSRSVKDLVKKQREKFLVELEKSGCEIVNLPDTAIIKSCFGRKAGFKNQKLILYTGLTGEQMAVGQNTTLRFEQLNISLKKLSRKNKKIVMIGNYSDGLTALPFGAVMSGLNQIRQPFLVHVFADPGEQNHSLKTLAKTLTSMTSKLSLIDLHKTKVEDLVKMIEKV